MSLCGIVGGIVLVVVGGGWSWCWCS